MKHANKTLSVIGGAVLAVALSVRPSHAQCAFEQPRNAKRITLSLVPAWVPCNDSVCVGTDGNDGAACTTDADCQSSFSPDGMCVGRVPNGSTQGGIPSCLPPQTFTDWADGDPNAPPPNAWRFGAKSTGSVSFRATPNRLANPGLNPENTADIAVDIDLRDIRDATGLVDGNGSLVTRVRFTADGRVTGDQTVVDVSIAFSVTVEHGKARVRTSYNAFLNGIAQPGLPGCTSFQLLSAELLDENGSLFAQPGIFLPRIN